MMKIFCACLMIIFFSPFMAGVTKTVFAQDQQPPSADHIVAKMQSKLNLTQDQVAAVTPIIEKYSSKRDELLQNMEDGTADRDSIRSQMKKLRDNEKQELGQVLSSDQISQWEQMQTQRHKHGSGGEGGNNGGGSSGSGS